MGQLFRRNTTTGILDADLDHPIISQATIEFDLATRFRKFYRIID